MGLVKAPPFEEQTQRAKIGNERDSGVLKSNCILPDRWKCTLFDEQKLFHQERESWITGILGYPEVFYISWPIKHSFFVSNWGLKVSYKF